MKYAIIIPDGCADDPQDSLGGKTPLQAANLPNMDAIVRTGICESADNVPQPLTPASDVATLSLFGYDPLEVYTGRSPLEAVAMGLKLGPHDWAVRCNLVHVADGKMDSFTAGHISSEEGAQLIAALQENLGGEIGDGEFLEFHAGVGYRNALLYRSDGGGPSPFGDDTETQPPHDIPDQPIDDHLPQGPGSQVLQLLMRRSRSIFAEHPVNVARRERGDKPATQIWLWGQGKAPRVQSFSDVYGKTGAIISGVDLVRGTAMLIGWDRIDVPGATGYLDTDYAAKGRAAVEALKDHDLVCVHVEAPDEASHEGKAEEKVKALERIDEHIVGPLWEALKSHGEYRILVSPDHRTTLATKAHAYGAVPFAVCGDGIEPSGQDSYDEATAGSDEPAFDRGHELMSWFLGE